MSVEIRSIAAGRGVDWIGESWRLFKQSPGIWIGLLIVYALVAAAASLVPYVGTLAMNLFGPVFTAGICIGCRSLERGQGLKVGHLFAAFQTDRFGPLVVVGVLGLVGVLLLVLVAVLFGGGAMLAAMSHGDEGMHMGMGGALLWLILLALVVPLAMALWFAAPLVALSGVAPVESLQLSFRACLTNFMPLLVWSVLALLLLIVGSIPFLLGWLIVMPMMMASYWCMYRDIFATADAVA